jgi:hypothetical protein
MTILEQIRAIADPVIAAGGTPVDVNIALRRTLGIEIGCGGGGNQDIPPCPYCGAFGGGGHGGFCPEQ